jgi:nitrogen fixation/metabolism regulation signal transduction histidine kinase
VSTTARLFAEVLKRAFEPYRDDEAKGTGLGLAVVKKIADEHGARIRIANLSAPTPVDPGGVLARGAQVRYHFPSSPRRRLARAAKASAASEVH